MKVLRSIVGLPVLQQTAPPSVALLPEKVLSVMAGVTGTPLRMHTPPPQPLNVLALSGARGGEQPG